MREKVLAYLDELEQSKDIKILLACETGSRAWGFPSPDSDFDIRIIYVHKLDWYLKLHESKDAIDVMYENNDIDITGWELKKALNLLQKSNAPLLERIQSPIIYKADDEFVKDILSVAPLHYSRIATFHHYFSMAKKMMDELNVDENYKLKKFFYVLRAALASKWIVEKEQMPSIEFEKIYKHLDLGKGIVSRIEELITLKGTVDESYLHSGEKEIISLVNTTMKDVASERTRLPASTGGIANLNQLLMKYIKKYDN